MEKLYSNISIIGAGTWGIAIANHLSSKVSVEVTHYKKDFLNRLDSDRRHPRMPDFVISKKILLNYNLDPQGDLLVVAIPVQYIRSVLSKIKISTSSPILILSKGIEEETLMFPAEIVDSIVKSRDVDIAVLSGPSHAEEVLRKNPTSVVVSSKSKEFEENLQKLLSDKYFRVYCNQDIIGVQLGGAVKNVISIAAGIVSGLGYGDNTISALLTRGIYELKMLGLKLGAKKETLNGLAGLGDLMATSFSEHSRNRYVGKRIGQGDSLNIILSDLKMNAEGVRTASSLEELSQKMGISLPICSKVYGILFKGEDPRESIEDLMLRNLRNEF